MDDIKVSFVMPIYNVEKYLEECLKSVLGQSLKEIEIICVNDGSTDASGRIVDEYAKRYKQIIPIHKENSGYGDSMNVGLKRAKGKYFAIIEPDDLLENNMAEELFALAEEYELDVVKSDFYMLLGASCEHTLTRTKIVDDIKLYNKLLTKEEKKLLFRGRIAHWTSIYRRSFLERNNIQFNTTPGASFQDTGFWFQTLMYAERVMLWDAAYYCYRMDNPNSSVKDLRKVFCICEEYDFIYTIIKRDKQLYEEYMPVFINSMLAGYRDNLKRISLENKRSFVLRMKQDFSNLDQKFMKVDFFWLKEDFRMLTEIIENAEAFAERLIEKNKKIHDIINRYDEFYIYGAGNYAIQTYKEIQIEDKKKFEGFLVSNKHEALKEIEGYGVYQADEIDISEQAVILVSVSPRYQKEIIENINNCNFKNYILVE